MFDNPLVAARLFANASLVAVMLAFFAARFAGSPGDPVAWVWAAGAVAVAGAVLQFAVSVLAPGAIRPAWDEQVVRVHAGSHAFGYWMTLLAFLALFLATRAGWLPVEVAFYWLAPVIAAAPALYMLVAGLIGRAA